MNNAVKMASSGCPNLSSISLGAAFFHSTPVSERKRKTYWDSGIGRSGGSSKRSYNYTRKFRRMEARQTLLRNVSAYADYLFQGWKSGNDEYDQPSSRSSSWFGRQRANGTKRYNSNDSQWETYRNPRKGMGGFQFCWSDDDDVETIFRSAFGGGQCYYWSFHSSGYSNYKSSWNWKNQTDYENDSSTDSGSSERSLVSDRLALGLSASGPLKLEEVKNAYRACALRWHPDRHQGSSKVQAEEKFKLCTSAYKSLCDKLALS